MTTDPRPDTFRPSSSRRRTARTAVAAALLAAGLLAAGCATPSVQATTAPSRVATTTSGPVQQTDAGRGPVRTVVAVGEGRVTARPDLLTVTLGVSTQDSSAQAAISGNSSRAAALLEVLRANQIADDDVQTSTLSVSPVRDKDDRTVTGYEVSNLVTVKLRDLAAAGRVLDAVSKSAGDAIRIQGLDFGFADPAAQRDAARGDAVRRARSQAEQMAQAAGVTLGPVLTITDAPGGEDPSRPYPVAQAAGAPERVPLAAGTLDTSVQVQVTFQIG